MHLVISHKKSSVHGHEIFQIISFIASYGTQKYIFWVKCKGS